MQAGRWELAGSELIRNDRKPWVIQIMGRTFSGRAVAGLTIISALLLGVLLWPRTHQLPDFGAIDEISARKEAFFAYLAPVVEAENAQVLKQRERLLGITRQIRANERSGWLDRRWLGRLATEYEVTWHPDLPEIERMAAIEILEQRVDAVPVTLALVQAATESGWGRSRFAKHGNNLFGHWCFEPGCGLVPARRNQSAAHEVATFESVSDSVSRYLHNLNTHPAYKPLRTIRAELRQQGKPLTAIAMADGLLRYSERREEYVDDIKTVIRINRPIIERVQETL